MATKKSILKKHVRKAKKMAPIMPPPMPLTPPAPQMGATPLAGGMPPMAGPMGGGAPQNPLGQ
jgi:hypothetical protein